MAEAARQNPERRLRIGTRGSPLALAQAAELRSRLAAAHPHLAASEAIEIVTIRTTGDRIQDRTLAEAGGKGLFTKEIEEALADGRVDLAVHSMKDMPTFLPPGLAIGAHLPREDPRDALFARQGASLSELPPGAVLGTASLRRQALALALRPDLKIVPLRGNVGTRLRKLAEGQVDATLLALAGLKRLGLADRATSVLEPEVMLPAVAQGCIGVEIREDDDAALDLLAPIDDRASRLRVTAERACLAGLDGSCRTPIAALAEFEGEDTLRLRALIALPDGSVVHRAERCAPAADAASLGAAVAAELLQAAEPAFLRALA